MVVVVYTKQIQRKYQKGILQKLLRTQIMRTRRDDCKGKMTSNVNSNSTSMSVSVQASQFIVRKAYLRILNVTT